MSAATSPGPLDDLGRVISVPPVVRRVVSLVPSLTEAIATSAPGLLVGATDWCTRPPDLDVARVRGTKNPDLRRIAALSPDLVVANKEENRRVDVERLTGLGIPVWVTDPRTVPDALDSLERVLRHACRLSTRPPWLQQARTAWDQPVPPTRLRVAVPIWRDPWMVIGHDTFAGDLLLRLGAHNVFADSTSHYPRTTPDAIAEHRPDVVLLPDEPYRFTTTDGPEAFPHCDCRMVSGRLLTWYGPSLVEARHMLDGVE